MKFKVTSKRGHHEAVLDEVEVQKEVFEKMTGKRSTPLPPEFKTKMPDTWQELEGLWKQGTMGYTAIQQDKEGELIGMKEFNPQAEDVVFIAPIVGG